jgi:polysaccharide export outer membrane protein
MKPSLLRIVAVAIVVAGIYPVGKARECFAQDKADASKASGSAYRLQLSDTVDISFPFSPEYNQTASIQPDGRIALKEAAPVQASGTSLEELNERVVLAYKGILKDPEVHVTLKEFQRPSFYASGEIGRPGRYELRAKTTLIQALSEAGGLLNERAKRTEVVILRPRPDGTYVPTVYDVKALLNTKAPIEDVLIHPGDIINVPQNKFSKVSRFIPTANLGATVAPIY